MKPENKSNSLLADLSLCMLGLVEEMKKKFGDEHVNRIRQGVNQVADLWRDEDGTAEDWHKFCLENFVADEEGLNKLFNRFQDNLEQISGHFHELGLHLSAPMVVDTHEKLPVDFLFSSYSPDNHLSDDFFKLKLAFVILLNFPVTTLEERMVNGPCWPRQKWAEVRLASVFSERIPASADQEISKTYVVADDYINNCNFYLGKMTVYGEKLFPDGLKLQSHWGLRDYLKGLYADANGLRAQRAIANLMDDIVCQTIPASVVNQDVEWDLNHFVPEDGREPDTRYRHLLNMFHAVRKSDAYYRANKTHIDRCFNVSREISEKRVESLIKEFLSAPAAKQIGELVAKKLGRPLERFDIWFRNFTPAEKADDLDALVVQRFPTLMHLQASLPEILFYLGFDAKTAVAIGQKIVIDPGRGAGHATSSQRREGVHRLRVGFGKTNGVYAPNYRSFVTFMHEFGHGVEMYFSTHMMDYNLLRHVPNTAFTEALAFVFQAKSNEILGVKPEDENARRLGHIALYWGTFEIAGVSLVDMRIWRWMYEHENAGPAELREAMVRIAKEVWNEYFGPIYGTYNRPILAIYSHIIYCMLYIPDYFLGALIQHQIQEYLRGKNLAEEVRRMYTLGKISPDLWMNLAVGSPVSAVSLIRSAEEAIKNSK